MWVWLRDQLISAANSLLTGENVSGALMVAAIAAFIWALQWYRGLRKEGKTLEPSHLIIIGAVMAWFAITIIAAGVIWHQYAPQIQSKDISEIKDSLAAIKTNHKRYSEPRSLSERQAKIIREYLLPRDHFDVHVVFIPDDQESTQYASSIQSVLTEGGWFPRYTGIYQIGDFNPGAVFATGLHFGVLRTPKAGPTPPQAKSLIILNEAFAKANVGSSQGQHPSLTPKTESDEGVAYILVGHRPLMMPDRFHEKD